MDRIVLKLHKIYYRLGPYKMDHLERAESVIEASSKLAEECLKILGVEILPLQKILEAE